MTTAQATLEAPSRIARPGGKAPYLHQIDLFRLVTFACVILIHVVGATNFAQDVGANAVETPLHFTREAFFALTGFVLVFQNRGREITPGDFWRRRLPLVATPYLAWSMFFWAFSLVTGTQQPASLEASMRLLLKDLATGGAWYHLYFLLVTMQVYLLFPWIMKLLRATEGKHKWLLLGSGALQVGVTLFMTYQPFGVSYETITHLYATFAAVPVLHAVRRRGGHALRGRARLGRPAPAAARRRAGGGAGRHRVVLPPHRPQWNVPAGGQRPVPAVPHPVVRHRHRGDLRLHHVVGRAPQARAAAAPGWSPGRRTGRSASSWSTRSRWRSSAR